MQTKEQDFNIFLKALMKATTQRARESREYLKELDELDAMFKKLSESAHNWIPVNWMKVTVDPGRTTRAEGSLKGRASKASTIVTRLRCTRCSQERDPNLRSS